MNKTLLIAAALCALPIGALASPAGVLAAGLRAASTPAPLLLPGVAEYDEARALFEAILAEQPNEAISARAASLDMIWEPLAGGNGIWLLREADSAHRGRGFLAIRHGGRGALQMPHSFKDEMTRDIGLALFLEGGFSVALWNTVPRHYEHEGETVMADMAHLDRTWFNAFTQAWAHLRPGISILQLHGFDSAKRKTAEAAAVDMILSSGERPAPFRLNQLRDCLQQTGLGKIGLYGNTLSELGGTTNAQIRLLHRLGGSSFVHMEISRNLRRQLRDDTDARAKLLACIPEDSR